MGYDSVIFPPKVQDIAYHYGGSQKSDMNRQVAVARVAHLHAAEQKDEAAMSEVAITKQDFVKLLGTSRNVNKMMFRFLRVHTM